MRRFTLLVIACSCIAGQSPAASGHPAEALPMSAPDGATRAAAPGPYPHDGGTPTLEQAAKDTGKIQLRKSFRDLRVKTLFNYTVSVRGTDWFRCHFPADPGQFEVIMKVSTGDADLYVRKGLSPTQTEHDCFPNLGGLQDESCRLTLDEPTEVYVSVRGYSPATSTVQLVITYTPKAAEKPKKTSTP